MAAADYASVVQQLYVSYFGRPADFYGLSSFEGQLAALKAPTTFIALNKAAQDGSNPGLTALINSFSVSTESTNLYGSGTDTISISKFVNAVYNNVLNRDADTAGLAFWVDAITSGHLTKANAAAAITEGALSNTTAQGVIDAKTVAQKVAVATDFTASLTTADDINGFSGDVAAATARALLQSVTNTTDPVAFHATVLSTIVAIATGTTPTTSTALTVNQDTLVGGAGNDIFNAGAAQNGAGTLINTLQNVDSINGGAGTDTLNVTEAQNVTIAASLTGVEVINARFAGTGAGTISLANATGVTNVNITGSTSPAAGTVSNIGAIANLGVSSQNIDAIFSGNTAKTINLNLDTVGKSTALNTVTMADGATTLNVTANKAYVTVGTLVSETALSVAATGANKLAFGAGVANLKTVTVTGDGSLKINTTLSAATKVDASANNGGLTATVANTAITLNGGAGDDAITYTGAMAAQTKIALGAGDDTLTLAGAADITAVVTGGDGTDTLVVTDAAFLDANSKATYTGFEVLEVSNNTGGALQFDPTLLSGITSYVVDASADSVELINLANNAGVTVTGDLGTNLIMTLKTTSGTTDAIAVTLDNGLTAATVATGDVGVTVADLKAVGVETATLHSNGTIGATAANGNVVTNDVLNTSLAKVVIDGATDIKFVTGAITKALTVDATAATGVVTVDGTGATVLLNINGGAGADVITGGDKGGAIYGGASGDAITLAAGGFKDTLVYKSAADSVFSIKASGALDTAKIDVVTNFTTAEDKIDLTSLSFSANTDKFVVQKTAADLATLATLAASADFYNDATSIARGVVAVTVGADTFVFADANHDHKFDASSDLVVKLAAGSLAQVDVIFG
jgi:hypothetical protein